MMPTQHPVLLHAVGFPVQFSVWEMARAVSTLMPHVMAASRTAMSRRVSLLSVSVTIMGDANAMGRMLPPVKNAANANDRTRLGVIVDRKPPSHRCIPPHSSGILDHQALRGLVPRNWSISFWIARTRR